MTDFDLSDELKRAKVNDVDARRLMYRIELSYLQRIMDSIGLSVGRVLDIGCGDGAFLSLLQERGWKAFGVEVRNEARTAAEKRGIIINDYNYSDGFFVSCCDERCCPSH